jgi:hypothetical protein
LEEKVEAFQESGRDVYDHLNNDRAYAATNARQLQELASAPPARS